MMKRTESGYILLTMLVLLLSVGGGWMSLSSVARLHGAVSNSLSANERQGLIDARQSLLSYAVLYPYLYGPTSAGPAHLPCPDTDGFRTRDGAVQSGKNQRRDGPNPPCASLSGSAGLLPRHTVLPGSRYLFHSQSWQRYQYHVAGNMVNNPLNRVVNLQALVEDAQKPVATISLPLSDDTGTLAHVTIRGEALVNATVASVAAWLIQRSEQARDAVCLSPVSGTVGEPSLSENVAVEACSSVASVSLDPSCEYDQSLAIVLDAPIVFSGECLLSSLESNTIEGVSALRHWYVRNEWYRSIELSYREGCNPDQPTASSCVLFPSPELHKATILPGMHIELYWAMSK